MTSELPSLAKRYSGVSPPLAIAPAAAAAATSAATVSFLPPAAAQCGGESLSLSAAATSAATVSVRQLETTECRNESPSSLERSSRPGWRATTAATSTTTPPSAASQNGRTASSGTLPPSTAVPPMADPPQRGSSGPVSEPTPTGAARARHARQHGAASRSEGSPNDGNEAGARQRQQRCRPDESRTRTPGGWPVGRPPAGAPRRRRAATRTGRLATSERLVASVVGETHAARNNQGGRSVWWSKGRRKECKARAGRGRRSSKSRWGCEAAAGSSTPSLLFIPAKVVQVIFQTVTKAEPPSSQLPGMQYELLGDKSFYYFRSGSHCGYVSTPPPPDASSTPTGHRRQAPHKRPRADGQPLAPSSHTGPPTPCSAAVVPFPPGHSALPPV